MPQRADRAKPLALLFCSALIALAATGCELVPFFAQSSDSAERPLDDLEEARLRWQEQGLANYSYVQTRTCECLPPYEFEVVVRGGEVEDVAYEYQKDYPKPPEVIRHNLLRIAKTVEATFDELEVLLESDPETFEVSYHPVLGYPTSIRVDPDGRPDGQIVKTLSDLTPLLGGE